MAVVDDDKGPSPYRLKPRMTAAYLVNLRKWSSVNSKFDWLSVSGTVVKLYEMDLPEKKIKKFKLKKKILIKKK